MGLPDYASLKEVKRAFKELAVQFHPDKNPGNKHAEERFKEISNAYNVLGEQDSKYDYDIRLSGLKSFLKTNPDPVKEKEEKRRKMREDLIRRRKEEEIASIKTAYHRLHSGIPIRLRKGLNYALIALGILVFFQNWFYTLETFSPFSLILAFVFMVIGNVRLQRMAFIDLLHQNLLKSVGYNIHLRVVRNFFIGLSICLSLAIATAQGVAWYQFAFYSEVTIGHVELRFNKGGYWEYQYSYEINGKVFTKTLPDKYIEDFPLYGRVKVRYSRINPVYARIIKD